MLLQRFAGGVVALSADTSYEVRSINFQAVVVLLLLLPHFTQQVVSTHHTGDTSSSSSCPLVPLPLLVLRYAGSLASYHSATNRRYYSHTPLRRFKLVNCTKYTATNRHSSSILLYTIIIVVLLLLYTDRTFHRGHIVSYHDHTSGGWVGYSRVV